MDTSSINSFSTLFSSPLPDEKPDPVGEVEMTFLVGTVLEGDIASV